MRIHGRDRICGERRRWLERKSSSGESERNKVGADGGESTGEDVVVGDVVMVVRFLVQVIFFCIPNRIKDMISPLMSKDLRFIVGLASIKCTILSSTRLLCLSSLEDRSFWSRLEIEERNALVHAPPLRNFWLSGQHNHDLCPRTSMGGRITYRVTTTPATELVFINLAYCSVSDLCQFFVPGTDLFL
ncbi:unnamed protein product [Arabis nemorensis]|uniref:Uncharacterized protein n=1 Tax=Arabis nemorensis TaxID=586526 RepID=A0A565CK78_9BRAS|nr:unnamed protein product [Arabis nemorensis]